MISITGVDKSHAMFVMKSPLIYLTTHHQMLANNDYQVLDGEITIFQNHPEFFRGSTTVSKGLKIQAQAYLVHNFCRLDKKQHPDCPKYFFVYQHRITVDLLTASKEFRPCKLISRNWKFIKGNTCNLKSGPGVQGKSPVFLKPTDSLIYQHCFEVPDLQHQMAGHYVFRYLREGEQATDDMEDQSMMSNDKDLYFQVVLKPIQLQPILQLEFFQNTSYLESEEYREQGKY